MLRQHRAKTRIALPTASHQTVGSNSCTGSEVSLSNRSYPLLPIIAVSGAILLCIGTYLHPSQMDPNVAEAVFREYAAYRYWLATHVMQFFGFTLVMGALVLLSRSMADGPGDVVASVGSYGAGASLATAATLQAIDGVALKAMVNAWAAAPVDKKDMLFQTAFAVRQVEIGLAAILGILGGTTLLLYGLAQLIDARFPKWLGALAIAGAVASVTGGYATASFGFSELSMDIEMSASVLVLCWILALAGVCSRNSGTFAVER
jgi:hypothetical protein